jgi:hypothetical protein
MTATLITAALVALFILVPWERRKHERLEVH